MEYPINEEFTFFSEVEVYPLDNYPSQIQCIQSIKNFKKRLENDRFWLSEQKDIHRFIVYHYIDFDSFLSQFKCLFNCYIKAFPYSTPSNFLKSHFSELSYRINELLQPMLFLESYGEDEHFYFVAYEESNRSKSFILVEKPKDLNLDQSQLFHLNNITLKNTKDIINAYRYDMAQETKDKIDTILNFKTVNFGTNIDEQLNSTELKWYGNQTELIELTKALIENGNLRGKQEDIYQAIQNVFQIKLNNIDQAITKFNHRGQENETKFLDKLKVSLSNYVRSKLDRNF